MRANGGEGEELFTPAHDKESPFAKGAINAAGRIVADLPRVERLFAAESTFL